MSGIAGIFNLDGQPVASEDLERMVCSLARRGQDGAVHWHAGAAGLGHRMLWTTPESLQERQPLVHQDSSLALTADARIDNRRELAAALDLHGRPLQEVTDAELILSAYEKWGEACSEKLIGDFAFAIWDSANRKLFCARDPSGVRPFYYYYKQDAFLAFGSQISALLCLPGVPRWVNELRVLDHLALSYDDLRITFYQDIFRLPPAHSLVVSERGMRQRRYWDLDATHELRLPSEDEYIQAFQEVFETAVDCRLRSAFPAGSLLSGGLDSSSIVAVARSSRSLNGNAPLRTFSAVFPTLSKTYRRIDERPWIEAVVQQGGVEPHYIAADELDPLEALDCLQDGPFPVPNLWLDWGCFRRAREAGVPVVLSGYDGDTVISYGQAYLADLIRTLRWKTLYAETAALAGRTGQGRRRVLWNFGLVYLTPPVFMDIWRKVRRQENLLLPFDLPVNPDFARRLGLESRVKSARQAQKIRFITAREFHRSAILDSLVLSGLELMDQVGAACGVEARMPFFDRRLLEFMVSLPAGLKLHQGWNRYVMRRAMEGRLPEQVQWRLDKGNLSANIRRGLYARRETLDIIILGQQHALEQYVDMPALQASYKRFIEQPMNTGDGDIFSILVAVTLAQWLIKSEIQV